MSSTAAESERVEQLLAVIGNLHDRIEDQADKIGALEAELAEYRADNERDKASIRQQVTEVEEATDADTNPDTDTTESDKSAPESGPDLTPMERLMKMGEAGVNTRSPAIFIRHAVCSGGVTVD